MWNFYIFIKPILFILTPESSHRIALLSLKILYKLGVITLINRISNLFKKNTVDKIKLMGIKFSNKVGLAAGFDKTGNYVDCLGSLGFGHIEIGTVTPEEQYGNSKPRLFRIKEHEAIINRMGFNNPGVYKFISNVKKSRKRFKGILGVNIGKNFYVKNEDALEDYIKCFNSVYEISDYVAINISSPNTKGLRDLQEETFCRELITALQNRRKHIQKRSNKYVPIVVKISPDLSFDDIKSLINVFNDTKVDGVIATNTTISREEIKDNNLSNQSGGLSGKPLKERSLKVLRYVKSILNKDICLISSGGIINSKDAEIRIKNGADLVQLYTGFIYNGPKVIDDIIKI